MLESESIDLLFLLTNHQLAAPIMTANNTMSNMLKSESAASEMFSVTTSAWASSMIDPLKGKTALLLLVTKPIQKKTTL